MAAHLEANPDARAVINFVPVLLEQIDDYRVQLDQYLHHGGAIRDPLLAALAEPVIPHTQEHLLKLIKDCLKANQVRLIDRYPAYQKLARIAESIIEDPTTLAYFDEQFIADLVVWYHLAWMGETVKRSNPQIKFLLKKQRFFNVHDRTVLVEVIHSLAAEVIPRYRKLAEQGRIEISMTPYAHPISPLLIDFKSTFEAMPDANMPEAKTYPGGIERNLWHIKHGLEVFEHFFGFRPKGCWPAEGSVCEQSIYHLNALGFKWYASGETVLRNSLDKTTSFKPLCIHSAYRVKLSRITGFFRDDGLSDRIGFKFANWHADDAVGNMIESIKNISAACDDNEAPIISVILDGENAWETYPENGYHFLSALYEKLVDHPDIRLTTYSDYLSKQHQPLPLDELVAGSWVYGTFSTWIGMTDKNRAWDMLVEAKQVFDRVMQEGNLSEEEKQLATMQLATCESSDWCWWFGDYNPAESVRSFDEQYRMHLSNLYHYLHEVPPDYLSHSFSTGSHAPTNTGVILPGKQQ